MTYLRNFYNYKLSYDNNYTSLLSGLASKDAQPPKKADDADFDMFAQSRTATYESTKNRLLFCVELTSSTAKHILKINFY